MGGATQPSAAISGASFAVTGPEVLVVKRIRPRSGKGKMQSINVAHWNSAMLKHFCVGVRDVSRGRRNAC